VNHLIETSHDDTTLGHRASFQNPLFWEKIGLHFLDEAKQKEQCRTSRQVAGQRPLYGYNHTLVGGLLADENK
jgi:hypothetical protein